MELYKRGKTWHVAEGINKAGLKIPRHTTKCKDKEAAKDYLRTIERLTEWTERPNKKKAAPAETVKNGPSLMQALEDFLATKKRQTTKSHYRRVITTQFIEPLAPEGLTHLGDPKAPHCRALQQSWVDHGLTLNTILNYRRPANAMYAWWIKHEQADVKNPWTPVAILKEIAPLRRECNDRLPIDDGVRTLPLDVDGDENWQAVHANLVPFFRKRNYQHPLPADPERFLALVELLYATGLRRGDGRQFQADFIDPHDFHYQAVQTKTGIEVSVGIPEALAAKLRSLPPLPWRGADPNYPNAGRYIFWDGTGDDDDEVFKKYMDNVIGRPLRELGHSLNIPGLRPHRLRDSFAVNSLLSGLTMDEVSRLLGHKSVKTTERYYCPKVLSRVRLLDRQKALRRPFLIAS